MYDWYGTSNIEPHGRHCIALKMEIILQQLGLANLLRRFEDERVDEKIVLSSTDSELSRPGVSTIYR